MARVRILVADSNAAMLSMTTELLGEEFEIVGAVQTGADTLRFLSETLPDVVVLDVVLEDMNGIELGNQLQKKVPGTRVMYFSMHEGPAFVDAGFEAGATGYVFKSQANSDLLQAVRAVSRGQRFDPLLKAHQKQE